MTDTTFPLDTFREAATHLRRPFTAAAVKFRVLQSNGPNARAAAYIDARLVVERLNLVVPHLWHHRFEPVQGGMRCDLTIDDLTRSDVGWSKGIGTDMDLKALYSDALKRAGVHFGIGVSLYAVPALFVNQQSGHLNEKGYLQARGEQHLRGIYGLWLDQHGAQVFGDPLDHGDLHVPSPDEGPTEHVEEKAAVELEDYCRRLVDAGLWDGPTLKMTLVANGARDTSTVGKALRSLTPDEAARLRVTVLGLLPAPEAAAA